MCLMPNAQCALWPTNWRRWGLFVGDEWVFESSSCQLDGCGAKEHSNPTQGWSNKRDKFYQIVIWIYSDGICQTEFKQNKYSRLEQQARKIPAAASSPHHLMVFVKLNSSNINRATSENNSWLRQGVEQTK